MKNELGQFAAFLRERVPLRRRLTIRCCEMRHHGSTNLNEAETRITLCIRKQDSGRMQIDSLIHEFGHVLEYDKQGDHSDYWGRYNAKAYRAWLDFVAGKDA